MGFRTAGSGRGSQGLGQGPASRIRVALPFLYRTSLSVAPHHMDVVSDASLRIMTVSGYVQERITVGGMLNSQLASSFDVI